MERLAVVKIDSSHSTATDDVMIGVDADSVFVSVNIIAVALRPTNL